ncbi:hypothetical protein Q9966_007179 [Columba livia]|nr:hypothetical protein Q9966_007179 [Columba livia]
MKGSGMHLREQPSFDGFFLLMLLAGTYREGSALTWVIWELTVAASYCAQSSQLELRNAAAHEEPLPWPSAVTICHPSSALNWKFDVLRPKYLPDVRGELTGGKKA